MDRPAPTAVIEITPEMIEAGLDVYAECNPDLMRPSEILRRIYVAMSQSKAETTSRTVLLKS